MKIRVLFGIFPVWLQLEDKNGNELNEITGFWSEIAAWVDNFMASFCHLISLGHWDREMFAFFPYESNDCKNWFQAMWKLFWR